MLEEKSKSEFGKGLVICLVKFSEHMNGWILDKLVEAELEMK